MRPTPAIDKYIAPLFRTTGEKPLLFTLEMELLGAHIPIKRTLKIPSNMNLGYVQEILMLTIGWEEYHLKEIRHGNYTYFVRLAGGVEGYADALQSFNDPEDDEHESIRQWMGEDFDPHFFDLRGARRRVDDFQRTIGEARWGFYHQ